MNYFSSGIERRLEKLEFQAGRRRVHTWDELNINFLEGAWHLLTKYGDCELDANSTALLERCRKHVLKIEDEIIREAAKRASPPDEAHKFSYQWNRDIWRKRTAGAIDYVPPLMGRDSDWDAPNIMARRAALRSSPDIAALLKQGENRKENGSLQA